MTTTPYMVAILYALTIGIQLTEVGRLGSRLFFVVLLAQLVMVLLAVGDIFVWGPG
jgi:hypothetical protein